MSNVKFFDMERIRLELNSLEILSDKKHWKLYFVLVTEHPTDPNKTVLTTFPNPFIRLKPEQNNLIHFEPYGADTDGLKIFERDMPTNRHISAGLYLRHCRQSVRDISKILKDIHEQIGGDATTVVDDLFGISNPWLVVATNLIPVVEKVLYSISDRDFGFVSMHETFKNDAASESELVRKNSFSSGQALVCWSWSIESFPGTEAKSMTLNERLQVANL